MANLTFSLHFHHMKDKIMEGFLYKYCPLGIIFSTAFSSIQVDVEVPPGDCIHIGIQYSASIYWVSTICQALLEALTEICYSPAKTDIVYSSSLLHCVWVGRAMHGQHILHSVNRSRLAIGAPSSILGFALIFLWVLGKFFRLYGPQISHLWKM